MLRHVELVVLSDSSDQTRIEYKYQFEVYLFHIHIYVIDSKENHTTWISLCYAINT